ncbi:MAG TPA: M81 family metallopeptidase [Streptosporangiaceae bacterium]|nr:M81 family metallopeptidase [Streptosporangiaceae bacterium]
MRALVAGIVHESSTLMVEISGPTSLSDFDVHEGADLLREFTGTNTCVGGYLAACESAGVTVIPAMHARAEPGAAVDPAAYEVLERRLLEAARAAGPVDVILLDLHGAGTLVSGDSLDLALLRRMRALPGPRVPLAITVDLHANLPDELPSLVDVLVGFQEYPHTDMAARAELAGGLAIAQARGDARPVVRKINLPMLLPPSTTWSGAPAEVRELAKTAETADGVLACTIFHGYPYSDTPQASTSVVTVADGTDAIADADAVNERIAGWLWDNRDRFRIEALTPEDALVAARGRPDRPVVIGDGTDNPGCGAVGDSTYLLQAMIDIGVRGCLATVHDPSAVAAAVATGVGADLEVALGGRHGWASGPPVRATATVRAITDGRVVQQTMRRGKTLDFGTSVRLEIGAMDVIVSTRRRQVFDPEILLLHGVVPDRYDVIAVKSVNHFRAGFASVAKHLLVADAPGPLSRDIERLPRGGPTAALWPMNSEARFASQVHLASGGRSSKGVA